MCKSAGTVVKGIGGFYYVDVGSRVVECRARGRFRLDKKKSPLVGDNVVIAVDDGYVLEICTRKNSFIRPPIANIDCLVIVATVANPITDTFFIDKITTIASFKDITPIVCINKTDLDESEKLFDVYSSAGIKTLKVSAVSGQGIDELKQAITGKISAFAGHSGVGKSSLLNIICPKDNFEIGELSQKISRGKNTTRHTQLYPLDCGGFVADTPGFSSFDIAMLDDITPKSLPHCFAEFEQYLNDCRFNDCSHTKEEGCAVLGAMAESKISRLRHSSYVRLYEQVKKNSATYR